MDAAADRWEARVADTWRTVADMSDEEVLAALTARSRSGLQVTLPRASNSRRAWTMSAVSRMPKLCTGTLLLWDWTSNVAYGLSSSWLARCATSDVLKRQSPCCRKKPTATVRTG